MILIRAGGLPLSVWQSLGSGFSYVADGEFLAEEAAKALQESFDRVLTEIPDSDFRTELYNARKAFFHTRKFPSAKVMGMIDSQKSQPSLAELQEKLFHWEKASRWTVKFEEQYINCLETEYEALKKVAGEDSFRHTLLFASHDLLQRLPAFCAKTPAEFDKRDRQAAVSVYQYLTRSIFKTSPLARFTTVQLWRLGAQEAGFPDFDADKTALTPSVAMLPALYELLLREPAFYRSLELILNPCIAETTTKKALSWLYFDGENEAFQQMQSNAVAELVVQKLLQNKRNIAFSALVAQLSEEVEASQDQLEALIHNLISTGLLEWSLPEKGLSPSWCSSLMNFLGYLPSSTMLTDAAFLLQLLRVSARALPFQPLDEARKTQQDAKQSVEAFFTKYEAVAPPIPAEQIFFADVERSLANECPEAAVRQFVSELKERWHSEEFHTMPEFRSRLAGFTEEVLEVGQTLDFQEYCRRFFEWKSDFTPAVTRTYRGKVGAMLQIYRTPEGYRGVVNAMFPGGGKLFARWMHLFSTDFREAQEKWNDPETILFPWQGWSNANFQSIGSDNALLVPDGRVGRGPHTLLLTDLGVRRGVDGAELVDKKSGKRVILTDLGLEAPESRPPVLQILWYLGVPFVSSASLLPPGQVWDNMSGEIRHRTRIVFKSLVLAREAWEIPLGFFEEIGSKTKKSAERYRLLGKALNGLGIPNYFFARAGRQKPQFFDLNSPLSMLVFEKLLSSGTSEYVYIEEMLPTPQSWVLGASEKYAGEFVLEFEI